MFDDINFTHREYDPCRSYGQSKTANVLFAVEASRRWTDDGITTNALHPGGIMTNLARYLSDDLIQRLRTDPTAGYKTPEQGAAASVFVATSPPWTASAVATSRLQRGSALRGRPDCVGVADYALDPDAAQRLWEVSGPAIQ